ncbi:MAG: BrnT family toxin [Blastocatellia bacterium]
MAAVISGGDIMPFEWHDEKAESNLEKHGISFEEAMTVFDDPVYLLLADDLHSENEVRFHCIGRSATGRILTVSHTEREGGTICLISARLAARKEVVAYESENYDSER